MTGALGIIAGAGGLPVDLAGRCAAEGRAFFTIRLKGLADPALDAHPGVTLPIGRLGQAIRRLKGTGCDRLMFVGKVMRPRLRDLSLDWRGFTGLLSLLAGAWRHDDKLHRAICRGLAGSSGRGRHALGPRAGRTRLGRHPPRRRRRA